MGGHEYIALLINYGWHSTSSLEHRLPLVEHKPIARLALILIKYKVRESTIIVIIMAFFIIPTIQRQTCLYWARLPRRRQSSFLEHLPKNDKKKKQPRGKKREREREDKYNTYGNHEGSYSFQSSFSSRLFPQINFPLLKTNPYLASHLVQALTHPSLYACETRMSHKGLNTCNPLQASHPTPHRCA